MIEELVDIINEQDEVIATVSRQEMRKKLLPHRSTYILTIDSHNRVVVEIRTLNKDYAPGKFDACVGGVVQSKEDIDESAKRELCEEIGIDVDKQDAKSVKFYALGKHKIPYLSNKGYVMGYLYLAKGDAITKRQASEVSGVMFLSFAEMHKLHQVNSELSNFTHDSMIAFTEILKRAYAQNILDKVD